MAIWENILTYNEIIFGYFQLLSLILAIDVQWPTLWTVNLEWLEIFRLDLNIQLPNFPTLDYRAHFFVVSILMPAAFTFFFLFFFKRKRVVIWYFTLVAGLGIFIAGGLVMVLPFISRMSSIAGTTLLIIGGVILLLCLCLFLAQRSSGGKFRRIRKVVPTDEEDPQPTNTNTEPEVTQGTRHTANLPSDMDQLQGFNVAEEPSKRKRTKEEREWLDEEEDITKKIVPPKPSLFHNLIVFGVMVTLVLIGIFTVGLFGTSRTVGTAFQSLGQGVGRLFIGLGIVVFFYWIFINTPKGRTVIESIRATYRAFFLRITLFILSIIYIPVSNTLISAWMCIPKTCPEGTTFPSQSLLSTTTAQKYSAADNICMPCSFEHTCLITSVVCPGGTDRRLAADVNLSCSEIGVFVWPVSALMFIGFVVGVPVLLYLLTSKHSNFLQQVPIVRTAKDINEKPELSPDEKWEIQVATTRNSAKSLYMAFERKMKYYKLGLTVQRFLVVLFTVVLVQFSNALALTMCLVHFAFLLASVKLQPYISDAQDYLSTAAGFSIWLSSLFAVLFSYGIAIPSIVNLIVVISNAVIPISAWIIGFILNRKRIAKQTSKVNRLDNKSKETLKTIDININKFTLKTMTNFFLILGVLAFISAIFLLVGILYADANSTVLGYDYTTPSTDITELKTQSKDFEFAKYDGWTEFVSACCCRKGIPDTEADGRVLQVENWMCINGYQKLRLRKERYTGSTGLAERSGLPLRPMCGLVFENGICDPTWYEPATPIDAGALQSGLTYAGTYAPTVCNTTLFSGSTDLASESSWERLFLW